MDKNIGGKERAVRIVLGLLLGAVYSSGIVHGILGVLVEVVAFTLIFTGILGWCAVCTVMGRSTAAKPAAART